MSYLPFIQPHSSETLTVFTTYRSDPVHVVGSAATVQALFTTSEYLGSFCVTDVWAHFNSSARTGEDVKISIGVTSPTYADIAITSGGGNFTSISGSATNKALQIPLVGSDGSYRTGTALNTGVPVYCWAQGGSATLTDFYVVMFVSGFYTGAT